MKTGVLVSAASFAFSLFVTFSTNAADDPVVEWDKRQGVEERLRSYGPDILGDQIDPHTGAIVFEHTDVSLPGNSALEVAVRRRRVQGMIYGAGVDVEFGDWELMVPRIHALSGNGSYAWTGNRCSNSYATSFPLIALGGGNFYYNSQYSEGVVMDVPGAGAQQVLEGKQGAHWPLAATHVTTENWWLECATASDGGQGFIAHAPNGDTYKFDEYIAVAAAPLGTWGSTQLQRTRNILAASEVTDVHGNWVRYDYDASGRLTKIHSNDGRVIDLTYSGTSKLVSQVTVNGRVWQYGYAANTFTELFELGNYAGGGQVLRTVTQPDGRAWSFQMDGMTARAGAGTICVQMPQTLTVTHPYGMVGTFNLAERVHRQSDSALAQIAYECPNDPDIIYNGQPPTNLVVTTFETMSVTSKALSGPRVPMSTWTYVYEQDPSAAGVDPGVEPSTNWTVVQDPSGAHIKYYHYWNAEPNGGKLYKREVRQDNASGTLLESLKHTYNVDNNPPTPPMENLVGSTFIFAGPMPQTTLRPSRLYETRIGRNGEWYKTRHEYDSDYSSATYSFGAPTTTWEWSSTSGEWAGRRTTETEYINRKPVWVLPLVKKVTRNGKVFDEYGYDSFGRRSYHDSFGVRWKTYTYHTTGVAAGLVKTVEDGISRTTTFNNYKRGEPQTITRPDSVSTYSVVDNNGWRTSFTDANGNVFNYQYNNMGWLTLLDRPGLWEDTNIFYGNVGTNTYQRSTRGTHRVVTWYDAFMRPWKVRNQPMSGGGLTTYVLTEYDVHGRETFVSFPSTLTTPTDGTDTIYDALGRPTEIKENVAPLATTAIEYLSLARTRTTDPVGNITTVTSRGYGAPEDGGVMKIEQPEDITTDITRDIYGKMTDVRQYGAHNGFVVDQTQKYFYDARERLCRHSVPETGDRLIRFDNAGQMKRYATGQLAGTGCGTLPAADKTEYTYDDVGRVTFINYPGSTIDISHGYDNNGNVTSTTRGGVGWTYVYDTLNHLERETLAIDGRTYETIYDYNTTGYLQGQVTPFGRQLTFTPNGLGQATELKVYANQRASNVSYHADGRLKNLTYGNGRILTEGINPRQLLSKITVKQASTIILDFEYDYDDNGRVTSVTDNAVAGQNRSFAYDGAGRLVTANGPWGNGDYRYDSLGNLRKKTLGTRVVDIQYLSNNRINRTRDTADGSVWRNYSHDLRGNVSNNGKLNFVYDRAEQPTSIGGAASGVFIYDGNHKRVKQLVNGEIIYSVYSQSGALLYRDNATTGETTDYFRIAGRTIARVKGGITSYLHHDHLGSPVAATSHGGALQWRADYTPFGEERQAPPPDDENFTSHIRDDATGLIYAQARYIDPVIGRFLSGDPVQFSPAMPQMFNRYSYALNNPVSFWDPDGLEIQIIGDDDYFEAINNMLAKIQETPEGRAAVKELHESDEDIQIVQPGYDDRVDQAIINAGFDPNENRTVTLDENSSSNGKGAGSIVYFHDDLTSGGVDDLGSAIRPVEVGLAHELGHAQDNLQGIGKTIGEKRQPPGRPGTTPRWERNALRLENAVRKDLGITQRSNYYPK